MQNKKQINVLVTGVGAIIGYGVIKSLRATGRAVYIVGMDIFDDAVGQRWCDKFVKAKYAVDPDYIDFLQNVVRENQIDLVFFGTEQEIYRVSEARAEFGDEINKYIINHVEILELSKDKWMTREFLIKNGCEDVAIPSVIEGEFNEIAASYGTPFLLKPRSSYASKGIETVDCVEDFDFYKKRMGKQFMAQRLVGDKDHEYTVGVFGLGDGTYCGSISLKRKLSQEGATAKAEVVSDTLLTKTVQRLCQVFRPIGPTNLQFRFDQGVYRLLEVNPRISSSTSIRTAFGYNEAELCVSYFLNHQMVEPKVKKGYATRYIDEVIVCE